MKDIVIDNSVTHRFENPTPNQYAEFIQWMRAVGVIVLSRKLALEILETTGHSKNSALPALIALLQADGRAVFKADNEIESVEFTKSRLRDFRSNRKDHPHVKLVLITARKLCLTEDKNLKHDINLFNGALAKEHPSLLPYS